jgi:F-type H+-transporting ATPase subunit b
MAEKKGTAHTEVPSGGKKDFPPFQKDTFASQFFWLALIFAVLYVLMARVALPRMGQIMAARQGQIESDLAGARGLKDESDAAIAAYEKALADARGRAQALAAETREHFAREAAEARKALDSTLNTRLTEAEKIIEAKRSGAMANVSDIAIEAAAAIVERLTGQLPARSDVAGAVASALKR